MPSEAFASFKYSLIDVDRLLDSHKQLAGGKPGKQKLGHITRSGVVMLCAAWELYVEYVLLEASNHIATLAPSLAPVPNAVRLLLSNAAKADPHAHGPFKLAGDGWKVVYQDVVKKRVDSFNTPKSDNVTKMFAQLIGLEDLSGSWSQSPETLNGFVDQRGEIAHTGAHARYVKAAELEEWRDTICRYADETDHCVGIYLKKTLGLTKAPWRKRRKGKRAKKKQPATTPPGDTSGEPGANVETV